MTSIWLTDLDWLEVTHIKLRTSAAWKIPWFISTHGFKFLTWSLSQRHKLLQPLKTSALNILVWLDYLYQEPTKLNPIPLHLPSELIQYPLNYKQNPQNFLSYKRNPEYPLSYKQNPEYFPSYKQNQDYYLRYKQNQEYHLSHYQNPKYFLSYKQNPEQAR